MHFTSARVAAAVAALLFFCAPSVHATVAIDKSNCRTFDLGAFPADLSRMARVFTRRAWRARVTPCGFTTKFHTVNAFAESYDAGNRARGRDVSGFTLLPKYLRQPIFMNMINSRMA